MADLDQLREQEQSSEDKLRARVRESIRKRRGHPRRAPLAGRLLVARLRHFGVGRGGCATLGVFGAVIVVLALVLSGLVVEQRVNRLLRPPTPTLVPTPDITRLGAAPVVGPPSVDVALIRRVLQRYNSPAVDEAQTFYDLGVARGIDPAYCLAFFIVESSAGTQGVARTTFSVGNIRALSGQPSFEGYRQYNNWREGIADWYRLIDELYVRELGLNTIDTIVPVYAPSEDSNDPQAYITTVKRLVAGWRGY